MRPAAGAIRGDRSSVGARATAAGLTTFTELRRSVLMTFTELASSFSCDCIRSISCTSCCCDDKSIFAAASAASAFARSRPDTLVSLSAVSAIAILLFACATLSATGASRSARAASACDAPLPAPVSPSAAPMVNATDTPSSPESPDAFRNTARQTSCGAWTTDLQSTHGSARGPRPRRAVSATSSPIRSASPPEKASDKAPADSIPGRNGHVAAHPRITGGSLRLPGARYSTSHTNTTKTSWGTSGTIASSSRTIALGVPF
mmetsp:Transcript_8074/g.36707  ORF Transcript_8074/g.36707 Transcript_8074/m.36707 type:complete len:262 (-) Transcript_8074:1731-2516(-)